MQALVLALLLTGSSVLASPPPPTGHRLVRSLDDFENYVLHEQLPTILLVHSSRPEDCKYGYDCARLFEHFKRAAQETKGYVRFSSIDFGEPEGQALVKHRLQMTEEPPIMLAFSELPDSNTGRAAQMLQNLDTISFQHLKTVASGLLPKQVHRTAELEDFADLEWDAINKHNKPLVALVGPKISPTNALARAVLARVRAEANVTVVNTDGEGEEGGGGKAILRRLGLQATNATQVVGLIKDGASSVVINSNLTQITPDAVFAFAKQLSAQIKAAAAATAKQQKDNADAKTTASTATLLLPRDVFVDVSPADMLAMTQHSLPVIVWLPGGGGAGMDAVQASERLAAGEFASRHDLFNLYGISTIAALNSTASASGAGAADRFEVRSRWLEGEVGKPFATFGEAAQFAKLHLAKQNLDQLVDDVDGSSIRDFFAQSAELWKDESQWDRERIVYVYVTGEEEEAGSAVPAWLQAAALATKRFAKFVRLTPPYSADTLRGIHLDPDQVHSLLPYLVAYVPNLDKEREVKRVEEEEAAALAKEQAKDRRRKKKGSSSSSSSSSSSAGNRGVNFHIIPYETNPSKPRGVRFDLVTEYAIALLQSLDKARWESTILYDLPTSGVPHNIYSHLVKQVQSKKLADGTMMPDVAVAVGARELDMLCDAGKVCGVAFVSGGGVGIPEVLQEAKRELERSSLAVGVRLVVVDGACHYRVVEQFGGDAAMLPSFVLWDRRRKTSPFVAWLRGTLSKGSIVDLVRSLKRNQLGMQPVSFQPTKLPFERECVGAAAAGEQQGEEEDELIKEMRLEAEKEEQEKIKRQQEAVAEAKRLKAQQEAETKAARDKRNQRATDEAKKSKQEL